MEWHGTADPVIYHPDTYTFAGLRSKGMCVILERAAVEYRYIGYHPRYFLGVGTFPIAAKVHFPANKDVLFIHLRKARPRLNDHCPVHTARNMYGHRGS